MSGSRLLADTNIFICIADESNYLKSIINDCFSIEIIPQVKEITITLKKKYKLKLPDAVIAAKAIFLEIPFITCDKDFSKIEELELFLLNN
jgi:predicted nucleic acid-binding protein